MSIPIPPFKNNFVTLSGSHAYGLNTENSDNDYRGFYFHGDPAKVLGWRRDESVWSSGGDDCSIWEAGHFFRLAAQANPNVIEVLWTDPKFWQSRTYLAFDVIAYRDRFLSKRIGKTFIGYAKSCAARLEKKWDPKDASHLVRLVWSGRDALLNGYLTVGLSNETLEMCKLLKADSDGRHKDDALREMDYGNNMLEQWLKESELPDEPDEKLLNNWLVELYERNFGYR